MSFAKVYAISFLVFLIIIILLFKIKDVNKVLLNGRIENNGILNQDKTTKIESYLGWMYHYTNVHLYFDYTTKDGSLHSGEGKVFVFTSDIDK